MKWFWGIAGTAGVILSQEGGHLGSVVQEVGGTLFAIYMDSERIRAFFGRRRKVKSAEMLGKTAREGVPAEIGAAGNLESKLEYGNYRSASKHGEEVLKKAVTDVVIGRTIVFPVRQAQEIRLRQFSPVGVVGRKEKL